MLADDLRLPELITFADGQLHLQGRRLVLHDSHAFSELRGDLLRMVGRDHARRVLTRFGYWSGKADAAAMMRIFQWDSTEELIRAGTRMHALQGSARVAAKTLSFDRAAGRFDMEVVWRDSIEADEHLLADGPSSEAVCWKLVGYASGYASYCLGFDVYFVETSCRAAGGYTCAAIGRDAQSWGSDIDTHLPYFQLEDVQSKVEELSRQLKKQTRQLERQRQRLARLSAPPPDAFAEVRSPSFRAVLDTAHRLAPYDSSVLITGETGAGKEVLARHIHALSPRAAGDFVAINCAALPDSLLESELFGHAAGAFTGAASSKPGLLEAARGGTIFLDEVGDISPALQVRLLRVLQEGEVVRIGETRPRKINARILSATNRDLVRRVEQGLFREDLYYRLAVLEIAVPPLRERVEDILSLARRFVCRLARDLDKPNLRLDASCLDSLQAYQWPGNVRELENALERAAVFCTNNCIHSRDLPARITAAQPLPAGTQPGQPMTLRAMEQQHIKRVLDFAGGNRSKAAALLGMSQTTLWRRMKSLSPKP